ncbi:MAG: hypothetical protein LBI20_03575 [Holosporales bacterium]|jgi:hypothetical protein|nr:hypothetical protein [Holosporales bacterium]
MMTKFLKMITLTACFLLPTYGLACETAKFPLLLGMIRELTHGVTHRTGDDWPGSDALVDTADPLVLRAFQLGRADVDRARFIPPTILFADFERLVQGEADGRSCCLEALKLTGGLWLEALNPGQEDAPIRVSPYSGADPMWSSLGFEVDLGASSGPADEMSRLCELTLAYLAGYERARHQRMQEELEILEAPRALALVSGSKANMLLVGFSAAMVAGGYMYRYWQKKKAYCCDILHLGAHA